MKTRWFKSLLAVMIACVGFVGCEKPQVEPEPSSQADVEALESQVPADEAASKMMEMGADAAEAQHDEPAAKKE